MDWIGLMVTLKAISGWDGMGWMGWVILYIVTPRASLQSDANKIPALMAKGSIPPNAALVHSTPILASFSKILIPQKIAVLCTDGRVK